ncbi:MAG: alpha/beta fold hydrolase [Promethearchaeota archaeon]
MSFAEVNGINICYEIFGNGFPLILIHGFGSKKEVFIAQIEALSKDFKVIRFDNRGAGQSDRPKGAYNMSMFAADVKGLLDHLNIKKAHILGYSLGGMIAQQFALDHPDRLDKLILVNTTCYFPDDETGIEMYKQSKISYYNSLIEDSVKTFYDNATPGFSRSFKKMMLANPKQKFHNSFSAEDLIEIKKTNPATPEDIISQAEALKGFDLRDKLINIKNQTLIITASHDRTLPKLMSDIIYKKLPNSEIVVIQKAGHSSIQEKAPEINNLILEFLKK